MQDALSLINELTEENERLRIENGKDKLWERLLKAEGYKEYVDKAKADTVRKVVERLRAVAYQSSDWSHGGHPMVVELDDIDQIAEEMIGGNNGNKKD